MRDYWEVSFKRRFVNGYGSIKALQYSISVCTMIRRYLRMIMPWLSCQKLNPYDDIVFEPWYGLLQCTKSHISPIKQPHGLIYSQLCWMLPCMWTLFRFFNKIDTHLGGAVSTLGHVCSDEHVHKLYFVFWYNKWTWDGLGLEPKQVSLFYLFCI